MRAIGLGQLRFTLEATTKHEIADNAPLWVSGNVSITNFGAKSGYLAPLQLDQRPFFLPPGRGSNTLLLNADISNAQLQTIEDTRVAEVKFALDLNGYVLLDGTPGPFFNSRVEYEAKQSDWINLLEQMDYRRIVLIEVDAPNTSRAPEMAHAVRYFQEAQKHYQQHEWRHTVESLRQSLAALVGEDINTEKAEAEVAQTLKVLRKTARAEKVGYYERYEPVRQAMKFLCDLGAHPDVDETTKKHANASLLIVAGLLEGLGK
jgi:hypothetical protein